MRARSVLLLALSAVMAASSWMLLAGGAGASAEAKKAKLKCPQGDAAIAQIEPLFDINANTENSLKKRLSAVQFGNLKAVKEQIQIVDANNPVGDVRAQPIADIQFIDKTSATGNLTITFSEGTSTLDQGQQFFLCVGKDQNGSKKGKWLISLYSLCSLYALNPCSDDLTNKAIKTLTPGLLELTTQ